MLAVMYGLGSAGMRLADMLKCRGYTVFAFDPSRRAESVAITPGGVVLLVQSEAGLLDVSADVAVVASPAALHLGHATALAMSHAWARVPVYVEKPLVPAAVAGGWRAQWLPALLHSASAVGFQFRSHQLARGLRAWVLDQPQRVMSATFYVATNMSRWPGRTYGAALDECSHEVDAALWLFGRGRVVAARSNASGSSWSIVLRHDSGVLSTVRIVGDAERDARWWAVEREDGRVCTWDHEGSLIESWHGDVSHRDARVLDAADPQVAISRAYGQALDAFLTGRPRCTVSAGLETARACRDAVRLAGKPQ